MRCLVKCIALFGLGIGLYLGDLKHVVQHTDFEKAQQFIEAGDYMALHRFVKGLSEKIRSNCSTAPPWARRQTSRTPTGRP